MTSGILHVITSVDRGGAETMLLRLCKDIHKHGIPVGVLSLRKSKGLVHAFNNAGVRIHALSNILRLKKELGFLPDVIQGWLPHGNMMSLFIRSALFPRARLIWSIRQSLHSWGTGNPITQVLIRMGARFSHIPDNILYNSRTGQLHHTAIGYSVSQSMVIPNGFEIDLLQSAGRLRNQIRTKLGISTDDVVIIHVARYNPAKDHETFLKATVKVANNNSHLKVLCLGRGVDNANKDLINLIPSSLRSRYSFLGECEDVPSHLGAADVYCSSSITEAFSNSIGEAMCMGLPCVVTDVGDSRSIVDQVGIVVPPGDVDALSQGIFNFTNLTSQQREDIGRKSYNRMNALYNIETIGASYLELYGAHSAGVVRHS